MINRIPCLEAPARWTEAEFILSDFVVVEPADKLTIQMQYPLLCMEHAEKQCLVRSEVYERLKAASSLLPEGIGLCVWDAWRPFALQKELYEKYSALVTEEFQLQNCSKEEREAVIRKFVSEPEKNEMVPPVHTTGGSVDVTLVDKTGKLLSMGTEFDEFSEKSDTAYFENTSEEEIKKNRRMLYRVMTEAGFTNLPSEWWHYDYGNRFWGYYMKRPAIYRGVFTKEEINGKRRTES